MSVAQQGSARAAVPEVLSELGSARLAHLPFDHDRRMMSVLVEHAGAVRLVTKGAPETVLSRCVGVPASAAAVVDQRFRSVDRPQAKARSALQRLLGRGGRSHRIHRRAGRFSRGARRTPR